MNNVIMGKINLGVQATFSETTRDKPVEKTGIHENHAYQGIDQRWNHLLAGETNSSSALRNKEECDSDCGFGCDRIVDCDLFCDQICDVVCDQDCDAL